MTRWLHASINKHFETLVDDVLGTIPGFFDDYHGKKNEAIRYEVRLEGPNYTETDPTRTRVDCIVQVILTMQKGAPYDRDSVKGAIQEQFTDIRIFRYGGRIGDDSTFVFCLQLVNDTGKMVRTKSMPNPEATSQDLIEGSYRGYYDGNL